MTVRHSSQCSNFIDIVLFCCNTHSFKQALKGVKANSWRKSLAMSPWGLDRTDRQRIATWVPIIVMYVSYRNSAQMATLLLWCLSQLQAKQPTLATASLRRVFLRSSGKTSSWPCVEEQSNSLASAAGWHWAPQQLCSSPLQHEAPPVWPHQLVVLAFYQPWWDLWF